MERRTCSAGNVLLTTATRSRVRPQAAAEPSRQLALRVYNRYVMSSLGPFSFHTPFVTKHRVKTWWQDSMIGDVVFAPLERDGELAKATHYVVDDEDPVSVVSVDDLTAASKTWRDRSYATIYAGDRNTPSWLLHLRFTTRGPHVGIQVQDDPGGKLRERYDTWLAEWSRGLAANDLHLSIGYMAPEHDSYPRPRPPRTGTAWPLGKLDMYLGQHWHAEHDPGKDVFKRIRSAPLTAGVRRIDVSDDVMRIAFDCDLGDAASVQRALALGERWLSPLIPTEVEPGWNEDGDEMIIPKTPKDRDPFTFFDEAEHVGYWALIRDPEDGSVDEERWQKLAAIARSGELPDHTPVRAIRLIAPVRSEALALLKRASADGFEMVTYPGGEGVFWRVWPAA